MSRIEHNPPAFPVERYARSPGMTLRDWFAGQALAGMLTHENIPWASDYAEIEPNRIAGAAYELADAMLAERQKDTNA